MLLDVLDAVVTERTVVLPESRIASPRLDPCESVDGQSPAYEVMYLIDTDDARVPALRAALDEIGEAVVVSGGDGLWNVHVHTDDAPAAVELGAAAGRPHDVRVTEIGDHRERGGSPDVDKLPAALSRWSSPRAPGALPVCDLLTRSGAYIVEPSELVELGASELVILVDDEGTLVERVRQIGGVVRLGCITRSQSRRQCNSFLPWRCMTRTGRWPMTQPRCKRPPTARAAQSLVPQAMTS